MSFLICLLAVAAGLTALALGASLQQLLLGALVLALVSVWRLTEGKR